MHGGGGASEAARRSGLRTSKQPLSTAWARPARSTLGRALKLQAMKAALEGRGAVAGARLPANELMTLLLGRGGLDSGQRDRLIRALDAAHAPVAE